MKSVNRVFPCWPGPQCPGPRAALKLAGSQASRIVMIFVLCALARQAKSTATPIPVVNHLIVPPSCRAFASITEGLASPEADARIQSDALVGTVKRKGAELPPFLYFAVECSTLPSMRTYNQIPRSRAPTADQFRRAHWLNQSQAPDRPSDRPKIGWIPGRKSRLISTAT